MLKGLAARRLAEAGASSLQLETLQRCLDEGEAVLSAGTLKEVDIARWAQLNPLFHANIGFRHGALFGLDNTDPGTESTPTC